MRKQFISQFFYNPLDYFLNDAYTVDINEFLRAMRIFNNRPLHANSVGIDLPVLVINGINDGPTLLLNSTDHDAEIQGIEVILRLMREHVRERQKNRSYDLY